MVNRLNNGTHDKYAKGLTASLNMIKYYKKHQYGLLHETSHSHQNCTSFISVKMRSTCGINNQLQK